MDMIFNIHQIISHFICWMFQLFPILIFSLYILVHGAASLYLKGSAFDDDNHNTKSSRITNQVDDDSLYELDAVLILFPILGVTPV